MKNNLKTLIIVLSLFFVAFGTYVIIDKVVYNKDNQNNTNVEQVNQGTENTENTINETQNEVKDNTANVEKSSEKANNELKEITISDDEILDILIDAKAFESVSELTTDDMLLIVYNALNEGKIKAYKDRDTNAAKVTYTEGEVNGIIYSLFGVKLDKNKSLGTSFVYKDGVYTLEHSDRGESVPVAKNVENDVAAGTMYICYDLYYNVNGKEELKGSYAIGRNNNTKLVRCKKEM